MMRPEGQWTTMQVQTQQMKSKALGLETSHAENMLGNSGHTTASLRLPGSRRNEQGNEGLLFRTYICKYYAIYGLKRSARWPAISGLQVINMAIAVAGYCVLANTYLVDLIKSKSLMMPTGQVNYTYYAKWCWAVAYGTWQTVHDKILELWIEKMYKETEKEMKEGRKRKIGGWVQAHLQDSGQIRLLR